MENDKSSEQHRKTTIEVIKCTKPKLDILSKEGESQKNCSKTLTSAPDSRKQAVEMIAADRKPRGKSAIYLTADKKKSLAKTTVMTASNRTKSTIDAGHDNMQSAQRSLSRLKKKN